MSKQVSRLKEFGGLRQYSLTNRLVPSLKNGMYYERAAASGKASGWEPVNILISS